jgi:protein SCO1/2
VADAPTALAGSRRDSITAPRARRPPRYRGRVARRDLRLLLAACLVAMCAAAAVAFAAGEPAPEHAPRLDGPPPPAQFRGRLAPALRLRDARGGVLDTRALRGRPLAVTFLYTRCIDSCPLIGAELHDALAALGPAAQRVAVLAISVDPAHDTPAAVRRWLALRREPPQFHYLLGTTRELMPAWNAWFAEPQDTRYPTSTHTAAIWLVDRRGHPRALYDAAALLPPGALAHDLRALLRERAT